MGCGSSKSTAVVPMAMPRPTEAVRSPEEEQISNKPPTKARGTTEAIIRVKQVSDSCDSIPVESQYGSTDSIISSTNSNNTEHRNGSAKSKDSGIGSGECTDVIITENSSPVLKDVASVPENAANLELAVDGKQMKTPGPVGHRRRSHGRLPPVDPRGRQKIRENSTTEKNKDEDALEAILQKHVQFAEVLIDELPATSSIVKRPVSRGGVAFDIGTAEEKVATTKRGARKPACVLKYAQHRRAAEVVTHAELDEKQKAADQRRKVSKFKAIVIQNYVVIIGTRADEVGKNMGTAREGQASSRGSG